jgi:hypothetical protein
MQETQMSCCMASRISIDVLWVISGHMRRNKRCLLYPQ